MKSVRNDADGWQIECWQWAQAKQHFEIHGFEERHHHFVEELRLAYDCQVDIVQNKAVFIPLNVTPEQRSQLRPKVD